MWIFLIWLLDKLKIIRVAITADYFNYMHVIAFTHLQKKGLHSLLCSEIKCGLDNHHKMSTYVQLR